MNISFKKVVFPLFSIFLFALLIYFTTNFSSEEISLFIKSAGVFAPLLYIFIQIAGQIFAPLSTSALFVAGFILFGKTAIAYSILTWLITSATNFLLARRYGKNVLRKFIGEEGVTKIVEIAKRIDKKKFFWLRISTFYINDFASYAFGLTDISFSRYYLVSILSMIPWSIVMSLLMRSEQSPIFTTIKIFLSMIPFAILSYLFLKKKKK